MRRLFLIPIIAGLLLAACNSKYNHAVPSEPDYADSASWYAVDRQASVDLFYITSTETDDYTVAGVAMHHADVGYDSIRALLLGEMLGINNMYGEGFNFYTPYYRQCTMETYTSDSLLSARWPLAAGDIRRAFDYYMKHLNGGRPFILMGFSQGAAGVVELLKSMSDEDCSRMVAAYVVGWKVTDADLAAAAGRIRAAQDSADLGVTVCFNSVRTPDCAIPIISGGNRLAINPANWCTDATRATWVYSGDTLSATLDTASRLVLVYGYTGDYMLPLIGRDGNYHCLDITIYRESLCRNIALRASRAMHD